MIWLPGAQTAAASTRRAGWNWGRAGLYRGRGLGKAGGDCAGDSESDNEAANDSFHGVTPFLGYFERMNPKDFSGRTRWNNLRMSKLRSLRKTLT